MQTKDRLSMLRIKNVYCTGDPCGRPRLEENISMCGRFALTIDIEKIARTFGVEPTLNTVKRYNIAPTQNVVSIVRNGEAHLAELRWGRILSWAKDASIGCRAMM